ncbi:MAG: dihydropteroate synthase [Actinomycetota bacterium]|nr:dihydropteroate synthase [Actinomycetota bacterium]
MEFRFRDTKLSLDRVAVMGVLNVTPDSFSDGGLWLDPDLALAHGLEMAADGAALVDVGGESTRPGADPVPEDEELRRVIPVVEALARGVDVPLSIDTRRAPVAARALEAGASIVNDTGGEESDPEMAAVIAASGAGVIAMHSRGSPGTMQHLTTYADVVKEVADFLTGRADHLKAMGVPHESVVLDPGFGFAKTVEQNLELLARFDELTALGFPVLAGVSRKSFIGKILDVGVAERIEGTLAAGVWAVTKGARIVRAHDVRETVRAVRMTEAIQQALPEGSESRWTASR